MKFANNIATAKTHEGGPAFVLSDKQELVKLVLTSFIEDSFYEKFDDKIKRIKQYVAGTDTDFLLKLAVFGREYGLRTVNHIVFIEALLKMRGQKGNRDKLIKYFNRLVRRPDELIAMVGYYAFSTRQNLNDIKLPNSLKAIMKKKFESFSEFQLAKYKGKGGAINLFDIVNITHPKSDAIDKLMKGQLAPADTWEVELSAEGNNKETWERLMAEKKLGAIATIRNLRNMMKVGANPIAYLDTINWKDVFPFQAIQALDVLETEGLMTGEIFQAVYKNVITSFKNITENYPGKIAIGIDVSGSMSGTQVSKLSKLDRLRMAHYYGILLAEASENADLYQWGNSTRQISKDTDIATLLRQSEGSGTDVRQFCRNLEGKGYDYIIILTDEQSYTPPSNVAKKQTIVWGLHDYRNTITDKTNGCVYFTGYNDIMWKIGADITQLGKVVKAIEDSI